VGKRVSVNVNLLSATHHLELVCRSDYEVIGHTIVIDVALPRNLDMTVVAADVYVDDMFVGLPFLPRLRTHSYSNGAFGRPIRINAGDTLHFNWRITAYEG
jgi:hypothetical protein